MPMPRNAVYPIVGALAIVVVAFQPGEPLAESGARTSHPVIQVPDGKTLLPAARPTEMPAVPLT
jgi:hypothetical protein